MRLCVKAVRPCTNSTTPKGQFKCYYATTTAQRPSRSQFSTKNWERSVLDVLGTTGKDNLAAAATRPSGLRKRWMEYQGVKNWEGLLDPLDDNLRDEIIRYGNFVEAAYQSFDFDPTSASYATCQHPKNAILVRSGLPKTGYKVTKNLRATSGIRLPRWIQKGQKWASVQSSWIGYVAVCQDKDEISRLGRRDIVIVLRGTATCFEWLENLRATLTHFPTNVRRFDGRTSDPMVESGFLSLYTSATNVCPSLQDLVREEIAKILQTYKDEPLSLTITGHSLGAALAILTAYDIKTSIKNALPVTVMSFGGPRVGNRSFRAQLEKQGTKILRIVNSDDVITKMPGFLVDDHDHTVTTNQEVRLANLFHWFRKHVVDPQSLYANIGHELRLSSRELPHLSNMNFATCHDLKTYLHLVNCFESSSCPFRATARRMLNKSLSREPK